VSKAGFDIYDHLSRLIFQQFNLEYRGKNDTVKEAISTKKKSLKPGTPFQSKKTLRWH
jgi:hypothetical protein